MTEEPGDAIPLNAFPDPALAYSIENQDARITNTNQAFHDRFGDLASDVSVSELFDRFPTQRTTGDSDPLTHLVRNERVGIYLDNSSSAGPFFVRVAPSEPAAGYLIFSDLQYCPEADEPLGINHVSSVVSHDLRNPLDVAKAHLQAAQETGDETHFESVADAHDRMEQIIRDVLTLTRGSGAIDPSQQVSIETAATAAWKSIDTDGVTLQLSTPLPTVSADPDRLQRLFENLFRNSVEHGSGTDTTAAETADQQPTERSTGEPTDTDVTTTITVGGSPDGFYIADDGPGIPSQNRDVAFEPGYSTQTGGTGLGLAIVEQIADAHGWQIELTASSTGGARIEISL
ncbi:HAMP domain-containing sensor histidine kinase [Halorubrum sp. SP9]|uniref:sensor histidine kinase n=1 Tax=Halorubrum sp. SP9 TaxID=1537267 RepID=UPI0010F674F7|nr:HAMP domain-containing sensor histidine kinase [Halorubrum sp. SP9]TKX68659.1 HAMP domain-containing histidine kinase [Halorubrum sp. SP9]